MNVKDVEAKLKDFAREDEDWGGSSWEYWNDGGEAWSYMADPPERYYSKWREEWVDTYTRRDKVAVPDLGLVSLAETFGGEGQGDQYYIVLRIDMEEGVRYFKVDGWYQSYAGGELDGPLFEVTPVEKTITVYERVK